MSPEWQLPAEVNDRNADTTVQRLRALWKQALPVSADSEDADSALTWLVLQYNEPGRAYHNGAHIERMFAVWREMADSIQAEDPAALALAIWFHDAIYDPTRRDNEERSAEEAVLRLRSFHLGEETLARVRNMILATAAHQADGTDADMALLLDLDLEILGAETSEYDKYAAAIRAEYSHVPDQDYRVGRAAVLRRFLDRPRIYVTEPMHARCEETARQNIAREIVELETAR